MTKDIKVLDADAVEALLPLIDTRSALESMFAGLATGAAVQPPQTLTLLPNGGGDFITYLGALEPAGVFGAKLSPYIVGDDKPLVTAWTCLMSSTTCKPLLLCDAGKLTIERTAGTTALAVDYLASQTAARLAIIGSGAVALAHLRHVLPLRNWGDVRVYSPNLSTRPEQQRNWQHVSGMVTFASSSEEAIRDADVVMLCTSSGTPVIDTNLLKPSALVTSISTNVQDAHEVPPQFLAEADVYCDYRQTTPTSAGEMKLAAQNGVWSANEIAGDLPELASKQHLKATSARPAFFRSIGLGLEDIAVAYALLQAASNSN